MGPWERRSWRFPLWVAWAPRLRGTDKPIPAPEMELLLPPHTPPLSLVVVTVTVRRWGGGSGGCRVGAPRCMPVRGRGAPGTAPRRHPPPNNSPPPLPPPHGEREARRALSVGLGCGCAAELIKHCICIALRYPPDWSCSERRIIYCGAAGAQCCHGVAERRRRARSRARGPCEGQSCSGETQREHLQNTKKYNNINKKNYIIPANRLLREHRNLPPGKIFRQDRLCPLPFPSLLLLPRCVSTVKYHRGKLGRSRQPPPGQAPGTPPV